MSYDKLSDYLLYRNIIRSLLRAVGLWPDVAPNTFYHLLPFFFQFANVCVTSGIIYYIKMHFTNFAAAMKGLSMMTSFFTIILKMLCVMINRNDANESFIFQLTRVQISMKSTSISTMLTFAAYVVFKVLQTFMYAYTGTCLTSESENYQNAIYSANWHMNERFMTSIVIMLSQKPILLTACNFSVISLNIFIKVLNTKISYFFLLQTMS